MLYRFEGLEGVKRKYTEATTVNSAEEITSILTKKMACIHAENSGALNIWITDKSELCCEFMQFCNSINKETYKDMKDVLEWFNIWYVKCN